MRSMPSGVDRVFRLAVVACLALGGGACRRKAPEPPPRPVVAAPVAPPPVPVRFKASPAEQRAALAAGYRLPPDARLLRAFAILDEILGGSPPAQVAAKLEGDRWTLSLRDARIGALPEIPSFGQAFALLVEWARSEAKARELRIYPGFWGEKWTLPSPRVALRELEDVAKLWNAQPILENLARGTRALTAIAVHGIDAGEVMDEVTARAVALTALMTALYKDQGRYERALLADLFEDGRTANEMAAALPADDPVRIWIGRDPARLKRLPAATDDSSVGLLIFRDLLQRGNEPAARQMLEGSLRQLRGSLTVMLQMAEHGNVEVGRSLSGVAPYIVLLRAHAELGDRDTRALLETVSDFFKAPPDDFLDSAQELLRVTPATLLSRGDEVIRTLPGDGILGEGESSTPTPFRAGVVRQDYYRAAFLSALHARGHFVVHTLGSLETARKWTAELAGGTAPADVELRNWVETLSRSELEKRDPAALLARISEARVLRGAFLADVVTALGNATEAGDALWREAARRCVARLDSRISGRALLLRMAYDELWDLGLATRIGRSIVESAPTRHSEFELLARALSGTPQQLLDALRDPAVSAPAVAAMLPGLVERGALDDAAARRVFAARVAQDPSAWRLRQGYVEYLLSRKALAEARKLTHDWLAVYNEAPGLEPVAARALAARIERENGKPADALELLKPDLDSAYVGTMAQAALALDATGKADEAAAMARKVLEQHEQLATRLLGAELSWRHGRLAEAAALLAGPRSYPAADWRLAIGRTFAEVFGDRPDEARRAFAELGKRGLPPHILAQVGHALGDRGQHELAAELIATATVPTNDVSANVIEAFQELVAAKGAAAADEWLAQRASAPVRGALCTFAFQSRHDRLLWSLVPTPTGNTDIADSIWCIRTAGMLRSPTQEHRAEIDSHYAAAGAGRYHDIGLFLLGKRSAAELWKTMKTDRNASEVAFWLGYRAQLDRRWAEASDWYQISVEMGDDSVWEKQQSLEALRRWHAAGTGLERAAADDPILHPWSPDAAKAAAR